METKIIIAYFQGGNAKDKSAESIKRDLEMIRRIVQETTSTPKRMASVFNPNE